ncbi:hypothetical protein GYH30_006321 [Glycine max]|nr:hypothetical protein GYH30_006321 [Glycine max]
MVSLATVPLGYSLASTATFTSSSFGFTFLFLHRNTLTLRTLSGFHKSTKQGQHILFLLLVVLDRTKDSDICAPSC